MPVFGIEEFYPVVQSLDLMESFGGTYFTASAHDDIFFLNYEESPNLIEPKHQGDEPMLQTHSDQGAHEKVG